MRGTCPCNETLDVTSEDITTLHSVAGYYVILPGHEIPDVERVVHSADRYTIVTKDSTTTRSA